MVCFLNLKFVYVQRRRAHANGSMYSVGDFCAERVIWWCRVGPHSLFQSTLEFRQRVYGLNGRRESVPKFGCGGDEGALEASREAERVKDAKRQVGHNSNKLAF